MEFRRRTTAAKLSASHADDLHKVDDRVTSKRFGEHLPIWNVGELRMTIDREMQGTVRILLDPAENFFVTPPPRHGKRRAVGAGKGHEDRAMRIGPYSSAKRSWPSILSTPV